MTSDGGAKIRKAIDTVQDSFYVAFSIEKLIVSSSASGPFLQRIATLTEQISYMAYKDPLEELFIIQCALTALRLEVLVNNPKLTTIDLTRNRIRQLFPITTPPKTKLSVTSLSLVANQLEHLDMSMFAFMPKLELFDVRGNRIVRLEATAPFDTRNLTLPVLRSLYIDDNALTELPTHWGKLPNLVYLGFDRNYLKRIDISFFGKFPTLNAIFICENNVETIRTSTPITMPELDIMLFESNQIVSVNFTGCNFPKMNIISLMNNRLTTIPPLFQRFSESRLTMEGNPIKCCNMTVFKSKITDFQLRVTTGTTQSDCPTTSSIVLDQGRLACCDA
ncbi:AGAP007470-PA [Anopheles gambiae str. PEST]|uniref:AGAP007470-PA n=1 Tax=Anopheles gambiae TaxID=7165 RepID=Q5TWY4_ANOGA|nr:AGAP007470-PA [Anopheles gambiae str. PEST]